MCCSARELTQSLSFFFLTQSLLTWHRHAEQIQGDQRFDHHTQLCNCSPPSLKVIYQDDWDNLITDHIVDKVGEGDGTPLRYSCLENPRDGESWWAAVYGVTQSRTRLKWLGSSSSSTHLSIYLSIYLYGMWSQVGLRKHHYEQS